jgi:Uma2 family endonuclease
MVAAIELPLEHMVLPNIRWETFGRILHEIGKRRYRIAYRNGDLEFTTAELGHHSRSRWIGNLIFFAAFELNVPICSGGSTTLKDSKRRVALEPDDCFWIKHEARMRGKKRWNAQRNPPPDLAIEVDIPGGVLDRLVILAALKVPEVWRFDGEKLKVLGLGADGKYKESAKSRSLPSLPMDGFARFVRKLGSADEVSLIQEFTEWLRSDVVAKTVGGERKNRRR